MKERDDVVVAAVAAAAVSGKRRRPLKAVLWSLSGNSVAKATESRYTRLRFSRQYSRHWPFDDDDDEGSPKYRTRVDRFGFDSFPIPTRRSVS